MKLTNRTGVRLFFIEFLIVLFFFLIISTVCLRLFAMAHKTTQNADALTFAQTTAASIAELIESGDGTADTILAHYPEAVLSSSGYETSVVLYFDRDFHTCAEKKESYSLTVSLFVDNREISGVISAHSKEQSLLYELPVSFHRPITKEEVLS